MGFVFQNALTLFLKEAPTSVTLGRHFFWEPPTPWALPYTYRPFFILKDHPLSIIHGTFSSMDVLYKSSHGVSLSLPHPTSKKERGNKLVTILTNYTSPPIDPWNNTSDHFFFFFKFKIIFRVGVLVTPIHEQQIYGLTR
jgi:hypothetical protein